MEETTLANLYQKYTYLLVEIVKKEFRIPIKKSYEIEYTLSLHLMSCEYYSYKLEEALT